MMTILLTVAITVLICGLLSGCSDEEMGTFMVVLGIFMLLFWAGGKFAHMGKEEPVPATITLEETGPVRL